MSPCLPAQSSKHEEDGFDGQIEGLRVDDF